MPTLLVEQRTASLQPSTLSPSRALAAKQKGSPLWARLVAYGAQVCSPGHHRNRPEPIGLQPRFVQGRSGASKRPQGFSQGL